MEINYRTPIVNNYDDGDYNDVIVMITMATRTIMTNAMMMTDMTIWS